jgi:peptidoglycan hydrolase-like protein with peptidoglycan-binding domain
MHRSQQSGSFVRAVCLALIVSFTASGCSSLLDPYIRVKELKELSAKDTAKPGGLEKVAIAAEKQREGYYAAISDRAKLRNSLPLVLLPLTAMALYRGATVSTDAGRDLVLQLGLLGAAYYGTANWYLSSPRERIYLEGTLALSCAIHVAGPYLAVAPMQDEVAKNLPKLKQAVASADYLQQRLAILMQRKEAAAKSSGKPVGATITTAVVDSQIEITKALVTRGDAIAKIADSLQGQALTMAGNLRKTVDDIVLEVNKQIAATEPEPGAVLRAASGLGTAAAGFAHISALKLDAVGKDATGTAAFSADPMDAAIGAALDDLKKANDELMKVMADVAAYTGTIAEAVKNAGKLDTCKVTDITKEITITPVGDAHVLRTGEPYTISAIAAVGTPRAVPGGSASNVKVTEKTAVAGWQVYEVLQDKPAASAMQVPLMFYVERTGARKEVVFVLDTRAAAKTETPKTETPKQEGQKPETKAPPKDSDVPPKNAQSDYEKKMTVGDLKKVQKALNIKVDGAFGPLTRGAIGDYFRIDDEKKRVLSSDDQVKQILTNPVKPVAGAGGTAAAGSSGSGPAGAATEYEKKLSADKLKALQKKMNVPETGAFDPDTRSAIKRRQDEGGKTGELKDDAAYNAVLNKAV